jgi:hypothetical protein
METDFGARKWWWEMAPQLSVAAAAARGGHDILPGPGSAPDTTAPGGTGAEPKDHSVLNISGGIHRTVTSQLLGGPHEAMSPHSSCRPIPRRH